jgi:GTP cyclohydrolase I
MSSHIGKSDPELGRKVREHLLKVGLETPIVEPALHRETELKIQEIEGHFQSIMNILGLDLTDDSLEETPKRVAKMFVKELFWGLDPDKFPKCTAVENKMDYRNSFVLEKSVTVHSSCEHHFVTIDGLATVAYIPHNKVLGLSKINRIVQYFSKRPQIQERLTEQVAETIALIAETPDVAVYIDAVHYCVKSRGIQDVNSSTVTCATRGRFAEPDSEVRREFLAICRQQ